MAETMTLVETEAPQLTVAQERGWTVDVATVRWFRGGNPSKGKVLAVSLEVSADGGRRIVVIGSNQSYGGVRHIDDPWLKDHPECKRDSGAWDYTEETKRLFAAESRLAALTAEIDQLKAAGENRANRQSGK